MNWQAQKKKTKNIFLNEDDWPNEADWGEDKKEIKTCILKVKLKKTKTRIPTLRLLSRPGRKSSFINNCIPHSCNSSDQGQKNHITEDEKSCLDGGRTRLRDTQVKHKHAHRETDNMVLQSHYSGYRHEEEIWSSQVWILVKPLITSTPPLFLMHSSGQSNLQWEKREIFTTCTSPSVSGLSLTHTHTDQA